MSVAIRAPPFGYRYHVLVSGAGKSAGRIL